VKKHLFVAILLGASISVVSGADTPVNPAPTRTAVAYEPYRVAFAGRSAGACAALWIGMHPEMADLSSSDPVLTESTRPFCIGVFDAQTSRDMRAWFGDGAQYGGHAFGLEKKPDETEQGAFIRFEAAREELLPWIRQCSPIEFVSAEALLQCFLFMICRLWETGFTALHLV
jgi:hypothetical protein